jgi:hypothetical protein
MGLPPAGVAVTGLEVLLTLALLVWGPVLVAAALDGRIRARTALREVPGRRVSEVLNDDRAATGRHGRTL